MQVIRTSDSLIFRIVAFTALAFLLGSLVRYVLSGVVIRDSIQHQAEARQLAFARYAAADIDAGIALRRSYLQGLARKLAPTLDQSPDALSRLLKERISLNLLFPLGLWVVAPDHARILAATAASETMVPPARGREDWLPSLEGGARFGISRPIRDPASGQYVLVMAVPVLDQDDKTRALVAASIPIDSPGFLDRLENPGTEPGANYLLLSPRGHVVIAATDPAWRGRALPAPGSYPIQDRAMAGFRGALLTAVPGGAEELAAVAEVPSAHWLLIAREPASEAFAPAVTLHRYILISSLPILVVMVAVMILFLRHTLNPLHAAAISMRRMASGQQPLEELPVGRGDEIGFVSYAFNLLLTKLRLTEARLAALAQQDPLTGLANRRGFLEQGRARLGEVEGTNRELVLLFLDIDGFKPVNDRFSHNGGDALLRAFAQRLGGALGPKDLPARFGGDEFLVLLADAGNPESVAMRVERLVDQLVAPYPLDAGEARIGVSIGVARYPVDGGDLESLVAHADTAMYRAKRSGRSSGRNAEVAGTR